MLERSAPQWPSAALPRGCSKAVEITHGVAWRPQEKPAPRKRPPAKVKDEDGPAPKRARAKAPPKRRVKMADSDEEIDNDDDDDAEEGAGPSAPAAGSSRSTPKRASRVAPGAYKEEPEEAGEQESD